MSSFLKNRLFDIIMKLNLKFADIESQTLDPGNYLENFKDKQLIIFHYKNYEPNLNLIQEIKDFLLKKHEMLRILAIGADWCPDCTIHVPSMAKIVKQMNTDNIQFQILYGVKVDAFRKDGSKIWHKQKSPPEAVDDKFDLIKIPTFYFFNKEGNYIGRIVEKPEKTLEKDLLLILKNSKN